MFDNVEKSYKISITIVCWAALLIIIVYLFKYFYDLFSILAISLAITYIILWPTKEVEKRVLFIKEESRRLFSAIVTYSITFILLTIIIILMIQPVSKQIIELSQSLPRDIIKLQQKSMEYINKLSIQYGITIEEIPANGSEESTHIENNDPPIVEEDSKTTETAKQLTLKIYEQIEDLAKHGAAAIPLIITGTLRNLIYTLLILMLSFYFVLSEKKLRTRLSNFFMKADLDKFTLIENKIHKALFGYIKGQATIGLLTGLFMGVVYYTFGLKYTLVLAIFMGIGQFVPFIGQALAIIAALIVALVQDPVSALFIFLIFFVFQIFSNNILVPILLGDMTGMNPALVIITLIIGERVAGILGVLLAVPIASIILILINTLWLSPPTEEEIQKELNNSIEINPAT